MVQRTIGVIEGEIADRSIVFFGGIHGNEPAGVLALQRVTTFIQENKIAFKGKLWALQGNLPALRENKRFLERDLNRIWFTRFNDVNNQPKDTIEYHQKQELKKQIEDILSQSEGEIYFFDLHTTSAQSTPFISISDTLRNRNVIEDVPVPVVLGLEEQMEGTLFSFFSELGISMVLYEAGQHRSVSSVDNHEAFIWLMLAKLDFVDKNDIPEFENYREVLAKENIFRKRIFELKYRHGLNRDDGFKMESGFVNFQKVRKNQTLANDNNGPIRAPLKGRIFMPLYQDQGGEGFFIISPLRIFWLRISDYFRNLGIDRFMDLLPGVKKDKTLPECFLVSRLVAPFFVLDFFHLLGYRKVIRRDRKFIVKRRPYDRVQPPVNDIQERFKNISKNGIGNDNNLA